MFYKAGREWRYNNVNSKYESRFAEGSIFHLIRNYKENVAEIKIYFIILYYDQHMHN